MLAAEGEHTAGACRRVIQRAHHARLGEHRVILDKNQVHHQPDHFTRGEILPGRFVGKLGEFADQFLEHRTHPGIADHFRMQVDVGEFLRHQVEQPRLCQPVDLQVNVPLWDLKSLAFRATTSSASRWASHFGKRRPEGTDAVSLADRVARAAGSSSLSFSRAFSRLANLPASSR